MGFLIVMGGAVLVLGMVYSLWTWHIKRQAHGTGNWPHTEGMVETSFLYKHKRERREGPEWTYTPVVRYRYEVGGEMYTSKRLNVFPYYAKTFKDKWDAEAVATKYSEGKTVRVYYNPNTPGQAVLEIPKPRAHNAELWYGVTNMLCGIGVLVLGIVLS